MEDGGWRMEDEERAKGREKKRGGWGCVYVHVGVKKCGRTGSADEGRRVRSVEKKFKQNVEASLPMTNAEPSGKRSSGGDVVTRVRRHDRPVRSLRRMTSVFPVFVTYLIYLLYC